MCTGGRSDTQGHRAFVTNRRTENTNPTDPSFGGFLRTGAVLDGHRRPKCPEECQVCHMRLAGILRPNTDIDLAQRALISCWRVLLPTCYARLLCA
jgi:hypothetical protein